MSFFDMLKTGARGAVRSSQELERAIAGISSSVPLPPYSMAINDEGEAEITLYGDIVQEIPRDWWTDEPIDGMYISLESFMEDLKTLENASHITVRIHSVGGDAYAAITIHNRLRELKAKKTIIVDGVAMSGGSLIMCAGDTVKVNPSSLIMIHTCWLFLIGGYNSAELRKMANSNDAVDKAQAAIYRNKTGISDADILAMMEAETYMTGEEAVEKGFADELADGERLKIAASADRRTLYVDGRALKLPTAAKQLPATLNIPTFSPASAVGINTKQPAQTGSKEGGNKPMANTVDELRKEYPELTAQMEADAKAAVVPPDNTVDIQTAVETERQRQQEIDEIAPSILDADMIREAKYGEKPCTAQELAFLAMKKQAEKGEKHLTDAATDFAASGANNVPSAASPVAETDPESKEAIETQAKADAEAYKKRKGVS